MLVPHRRHQPAGGIGTEMKQGKRQHESPPPCKAEPASLGDGRPAEPEGWLAELESFYRTAPVGLCMVDADLRYRRINERLAAMNGLPVSEHMGRTLREVIPVLADKLEPLHRKVLATGEPLLDLEVVGTSPAAPHDERVWHCSYLPVKLDNGLVVGVNVFVIDVTAQAKLSYDLRVLQHIVSGHPDHLSFVGSDYVYRAVNDAYLVSHGLRRDQIVGHHIAELLGKESFESVVKPRFDECLAGRIVRFQDWFSLSGKLKQFIDVIYSPFRDHEGRISGVVVSARNFTKQREAEEALLQNQTKLQLIADTIEDVVWILDWEHSHVLFVNGAYEKVWGRSVEALYEDAGDWMRGIHAEDRPHVEHSFRHLAESGEYDTEYRVVRPDGQTRFVRDRGYPIRDREGIVRRVVGIATDITERKRAEDKRHDLEIQLRHKQKMEAVGQLAAGLAHDVNSLLTVILSNLEFAENRLRKRNEQPDETVRQAMARIDEAVSRGKALIQNLLTFGRVRAGRFGPLNLNKIVTETVELVGSAIGRKVHIETSLEPDLERCDADTGQMQQVIMNLVLNASDAMAEGGVLTITTANATLTQSDAARWVDAKPGPHVVVTVVDTGIGMEPSVRERMFDLFFSTKPVNAGSGLGLSITYAIVKQSGGHIRVESERGKGTTIQVYLPAVVP